jgi:hypothetical protein
MHAQTDVQGLWSSAWSVLQAERPDLEGDLAALERALPARHRSLARLEASAAREAARVLRGQGSQDELAKRLQVWVDGVLEALAELDTARSERLCADCAAENVATVAPGLTGGRVCAGCLGGSP